MADYRGARLINIPQRRGKGCGGSGGIRTHEALRLTLSKRVQLTAMRRFQFVTLNTVEGYDTTLQIICDRISQSNFSQD